MRILSKFGAACFAVVLLCPAVSSAANAGVGEKAPAKPKLKNFVRNGGFETGDKCPDGWMIRFAEKDLSKLTDIHRMDHLTLFWDTTQSTSGKCIRMDTDVNQKEVHRRMFELIGNPDAPRWSKTPTKPPKYDTAAGLEGVTFWSEPIQVEEDKIYRMSVDCMGRMNGMFFPKMFVRGFGKSKTAKGDVIVRKIYDTYVACRVDKPDKWFHFSQTFCPTDRTPAVEHIRVMLMAYWPPGVYYWDNVSITEVPEAEAAQIRAERAKERAKTLPRFTPTPVAHRAGESFVIEEEEELTLPEK